METPQPPPAYQPPQAAKKGLGTGAKIGIGCGALALLAIIGLIIAGVMMGGKMKDFTKDIEKNPTRGVATLMVKMSMGTMEMVAEDDANKRYTVKTKADGSLTTIYWSEKKKAPEVIAGDFSAIPVESAAPEAPAVPEAGKE